MNRITINRKSLFAIVVVLLALVTALPAAAGPGKPNFSPSLYGDGAVWGTKGTTALPAPTANNAQSFDKLYVITNSNNSPQYPVSEAAPGNPAYNGGRWFTHTVMWKAEAFDHFGTVPLLTSQADIDAYADYLIIDAGSPPGGPPPYFQCPMLPVK